jgi:hypothetical protein
MSDTTPISTDFGGPLTALIFGSLGAVSLFRGEWVDAAVWLALTGAFLAAPLRLDLAVRLGRPRLILAGVLCAAAIGLFVVRVAQDLAA